MMISFIIQACLYIGIAAVVAMLCFNFISRWKDNHVESIIEAVISLALVIIGGNIHKAVPLINQSIVAKAICIVAIMALGFAVNYLWNTIEDLFSKNVHKVDPSNTHDVQDQLHRWIHRK